MQKGPISVRTIIMKKNKKVEAIDSDYESAGGIDLAVPNGPANYELMSGYGNQKLSKYMFCQDPSKNQHKFYICQALKNKKNK